MSLGSLIAESPTESRFHFCRGAVLDDARVTQQRPWKRWADCKLSHRDWLSAYVPYSVWSNIMRCFPHANQWFVDFSNGHRIVINGYVNFPTDADIARIIIECP